MLLVIAAVYSTVATQGLLALWPVDPAGAAAAEPSSRRTPSIVNVLPVPVCPYAKTVQEKPARTSSTTGATEVDITVVKNQAALMLYIEERFVLTDGGRRLALEPVGAEFEGDTLLLYQQSALKAPPAKLAIDDRILRDVFEAQANLVNVRLAGGSARDIVAAPACASTSGESRTVAQR